jgi:hypothetical protein
MYLIVMSTFRFSVTENNLFLLSIMKNICLVAFTQTYSKRVNVVVIVFLRRIQYKLHAWIKILMFCCNDQFLFGLWNNILYTGTTLPLFFFNVISKNFLQQTTAFWCGMSTFCFNGIDNTFLRSLSIYMSHTAEEIEEAPAFTQHK